MRAAGVAKYLKSLMRLGGQFSPRQKLCSFVALSLCNYRLSVLRYLSERRPIWSRGNVLRAASGTSHLATNFWDCEGGAKFGHEACGGYCRVMPATVAPAKDVDARLQNLAEPGGAPPRIFRLDVSALVLAHVGVPAIRDLWLTTDGQNRTKREH